MVTVNDYLAKRDAVWMSKIYDFLGLSVGIIQNQRVSYKYVGQKLAPENEKLTESEINDIEIEEDSFKIDDDFIIPCSRQEAYRLDIVYGTNNEFGF